MKFYLILNFLMLTASIHAQKITSFIPKGNITSQSFSETASEMKANGDQGFWLDLNDDGTIGGDGDVRVTHSGDRIDISYKYKNDKNGSKYSTLLEEKDLGKHPQSGLEIYVIHSKTDATKKLVLYYRGLTAKEDFILLYTNLGDDILPRLVEKWRTKTKVNNEKDSLNFDASIFYGHNLNGTQDQYAITWDDHYDNPLNLTALEKAIPKGWQLVFDGSYYEVGAYAINSAVALIEPNTNDSDVAKIAIFEKNEQNQYKLVQSSQIINIDKVLNKKIKNIHSTDHSAYLKFDLLDEQGLMKFRYIEMAVGTEYVLKLGDISKTINSGKEEKTIEVSYLSKSIEIRQNYETISTKKIDDAKLSEFKDLSTQVIYEYLKKKD